MIFFSKFAKASLLFWTASLSFLSYSEGATVLPIADQGTVASRQIAVAVDDNNNAVTVFTNDDLIESRYSPGNLLWEPNVIISNATPIKLSPDVATDNTGTALAVWIGFDEASLTPYTIETNVLTAGVWGVPTNLEGPTANSLSAPSVSMNGSGGGVAGWSNPSLNEIHTSFFSAGSWAPFTVAAASYGTVQTAYSTNGNAGLAWSQFDLGINNIFGTTSVGTSWQPATLLDATGSLSPDIGMDAAGNAIVIWGGNLGNFDIKWSRFDGATWSAAQVLSSAPGNSNPSIAVAPNGTAIAVWTDSSNFIEITVFNGTAWSTPTPFAAGTLGSITMDSEGNALVGWVNPTNQLFVSRIPLGGALEAPVFIKTGDAPIVVLDLALSSSTGVGIPAWAEFFIESPGNTFATFVIFAPTPPAGITGTSCTNKFASQSQYVHIINWTPSTDPTTAGYQIFRNGMLIASIPLEGPFTYVDYCRVKGVPDTYSVYAVNGEGVLSDPVTITLN